VGQVRKASTNRAKRGVQGRSSRRAVTSAGARIDQASRVSASERLDEDAIGEGVADRELVQSHQAVTNYSGLRLKAEAALEKLITAPGVPANVRASAVRTALELVGAIGARSKDQRDQEDADAALDPESLTVADIDREIGKLGRV
jgi:hypothetical protein